MTSQPQQQSWARETQHNPDSFWRSTGKRVFDIVMSPIGSPFDTTVLDDLKADNSIKLMTDFCARCAANPPVSPHHKGPHNADTLVKTLTTAVAKLKSKFGSQWNKNWPPMFLEDEVAR